MATLAVRPLSPRDLPSLRYVRQRQDRLDLPSGDRSSVAETARQVLAAAPPALHRERVFVALIDGELCALIALRPQSQLFRWDVVEVAAGSPRLDATDDVCVELWTALFEYAIRSAGEAGAKRLFAFSDDAGPCYESLRSTGFEPYTQFSVLAGKRPDAPVELPFGMRSQEPSDVWSVHQLYHQVTPRGVQFAEALTSSVWELPERPIWSRFGPARPDVHAYVLETTQGIEGYCRLEQHRREVLVNLMLSPACAVEAVPFVVAAVSESGYSPRAPLRIIVPAYRSELVAPLLDAGFVFDVDRVALVRHTTARAVVHARLAPLPAVEAERVPRGVPSYYQIIRGASPPVADTGVTPGTERTTS